MKLNYLNIFLIVLLGFSQSDVFASQFYTPDHRPTDFYNRVDPYKAGGLYSNLNPNNPYSNFRNPYDPQSVYNNTLQYGAPVRSFKGQDQGTLSNSVFSPESATNPYGVNGNRYNQNTATAPYSTENAPNPYSQFRNPYDPSSVYTAPDYSLHYQDTNGGYSGSAQMPSYNNQESINNPYSRYGNQYNQESPYNPYSHNPYNW